MKKLLSLMCALFVVLGALMPISAQEKTIGGEPIAQWTELSYEEYIRGIAKTQGITYEEAEYMVKQNESKTIVPMTYQKKYGYFSVICGYTEEQVVASTKGLYCTCGVYASYYVDSANWQLRYFSEVVYPYITPSAGIETLNIYTNTGTIINNLTIHYMASFYVKSELQNSGKNISFTYDFRL